MPGLFFLSFAMLRKVKQVPLEALAWSAALLYLAWMDPSGEHFSLCPLKHFGFSFCPGCGLGHSISLLFHGEWKESFHTHPLGIFAVIILTYRIVELLNNYKKVYGQTH